MYYPYFIGGRRPLPIETVNQKYVISDGVSNDRSSPGAGPEPRGGHAARLPPEEKIMVNADLSSPAAQGAHPPTRNANMRTLQANMQPLKLDVERHVPIYGQPGPGADFTKIVPMYTKSE